MGPNDSLGERVSTEHGREPVHNYKMITINGCECEVKGGSNVGGHLDMEARGPQEQKEAIRSRFAGGEADDGRTDEAVTDR